MAEQHQHNKPPQQHQPPPKPPTIVGDDEAMPIPKLSTTQQFRNRFVEELFDVVEGTTKLSDAKKELHIFVDALKGADKAELLASITAMTRRIGDIAISLASETPALIVKLQQGD